MTPREFVARVIDLFTFSIRNGWDEVRPQNLLSAALCIRLGEGQCDLNGPKNRTGLSLSLDNHTFELETDEALDTTLIRATMIGARKIQATIVFSYDGNSSELFSQPSDSSMYERWVVPNISEEEALSMLTYLILRTNYSLKDTL